MSACDVSRGTSGAVNEKGQRLLAGLGVSPQGALLLQQGDIRHFQEEGLEAGKQG